MSNPFENLFEDLVPTPYPLSIVGKQTTDAKQMAGRRFSQTRKIKEALSFLAFKADRYLVEASGVDVENLYTSVAKFGKHALETSKTFTVCPTCYPAFKKGKPRSLTNIAPYPCNICSSQTNKNHKIRHTANLLTARIEIRQTHPELFI